MPRKLVNYTDVLEYIVLIYIYISLSDIKFVPTSKKKMNNAVIECMKI